MRSRGFREALRAEEPLQLIGETSLEPWKWHYKVQDEERRSFCGVGAIGEFHRRFGAQVQFRAVSEETCARWMASLTEQRDWIQLPGVPRKVVWYVSEAGFRVWCRRDDVRIVRTCPTVTRGWSTLRWSTLL